MPDTPVDGDPGRDRDDRDDRGGRGDRLLAELGEPCLAVADRQRGLLAVAGEREDGEACAVGLFDVRGSKRVRWLVPTGFPVQAMAFHPHRPLLAVGTGDYDGGYHFEGELLLVHLETGLVRSMIEGHFGRQVLGLEWLNGQDLRILLAPHHDYQDARAHTEGHVAVVNRADWTRAHAGSLTGRDLAGGPRVPAPRPDGRAAARQAVARLT
ncbi:hypothetical protein ACFYUY_07360 [Kitasatospora sp. NPDC004745]|uniref:hypothetical protein n=1 Tax=Kitasatospora sp. NPDC004745 TaxID=3364019 RepID=UPI00369398D4